MILKQIIQPYLATCSYFIADESSSTAIVVDPQPNVTQYTKLALEYDCNIKKIFLTNYPSEFVAGHEKLSAETGAQIYLSSQASASFEYLPMADGDSVEFGNLLIKAIQTPGHTVESMCLLLFDLLVSRTVPQCVLTGDTIYRGDCGKPDLLAVEGHEASRMAGLLYDSIETKLRHLPPQTKVYPGHAYGSVTPGDEVKSTIEQEWQSNIAFHAANRDDFIESTIAYSAVNEATGPALFSNRGGEPPHHKPVQLKKLSADEVVELRKAGAAVIDFRNLQQFAGAHIKRSLNVPSFANLTVFEDMLDKPAIIVCDPGQEHDALEVLSKAGFNSIVGSLICGMATTELTPAMLGHLRRLTGRELLLQMESNEPPLIVDVRPSEHWSHEPFVGSINIPFSNFSEQAKALKEDDKIVVCCETEFHSGIAASLLKSRGFKNVATMIGGIAAWRRLKSQMGGASIALTSGVQG